MKEKFSGKTFESAIEQANEFIKKHDALSWAFLTLVVDGQPEYGYTATLMPKDAKNAMQELLCEEHEIIRHFWCKDDIRGLETGGRAFTEEEVDTIAAKVEKQVDCCYGINWDFIDDIAQDVAPDAYAECVEEGEQDEDESDELRHVVSQYTPDGQADWTSTEMIGI